MQVNVVLVKRSGKQKSFSLPSNVTVIGRRHDCDLRIPLSSVSKRHCQVSYDQGVLKVRDLGSRNGTLLNGKKIKEAQVKAGDYVEVGPLKFVFQIDGQPKDIVLPDTVMKEQSRVNKPGAETAPKETEGKISGKTASKASGQAGGAKERKDDTAVRQYSESLVNEVDLSGDDSEALFEDLDFSEDDSESLLDDFELSEDEN